MIDKNIDLINKKRDFVLKFYEDSNPISFVNVAISDDMIDHFMKKNDYITNITEAIHLMHSLQNNNSSSILDSMKDIRRKAFFAGVHFTLKYHDDIKNLTSKKSEAINEKFDEEIKNHLVKKSFETK